MRRALFIFAALFTWCDFIHADHRSALVIANHNYAAVELKLDAPDLKAVVARLERHGFQCTVKSNLDNNQLKRAIEDFAVRTPVRGTGLVYFIGQAAPGEYQGSKTLCLLDTNPNRAGAWGWIMCLRNCTPRAAVHGSSWWWMRPRWPRSRWNFPRDVR